MKFAPKQERFFKSIMSGALQTLKGWETLLKQDFKSVGQDINLAYINFPNFLH